MGGKPSLREIPGQKREITQAAGLGMKSVVPMFLSSR